MYKEYKDFKNSTQGKIECMRNLMFHSCVVGLLFQDVSVYLLFLLFIKKLIRCCFVVKSLMQLSEPVMRTDAWNDANTNVGMLTVRSLPRITHFLHFPVVALDWVETKNETKPLSRFVVWLFVVAIAQDFVSAGFKCNAHENSHGVTKQLDKTGKCLKYIFSGVS